MPPMGPKGHERKRRRAAMIEDAPTQPMDVKLDPPKGVLPVVRSPTGGLGPEGKKVMVRATTARRQAAVDFITDPESRSVEWHFNREDRDYKSIISISGFLVWSREDRWLERRTQWFADLERRLLEELQDRFLVRRIREIEELTEARDAMMEYMRPLKDPSTGLIRRNEEGLPEFPLKLPEFDKFIQAFLKVEERLMLKRGETIQRTEQITRDTTKTSVTTALTDPVGQHAMLSDADVKVLARAFLVQRQPELAEALSRKLEAENEDGESDEAQDDEPKI